MVESKIRVEVTEFSNMNNPFYGNTIRKKVVEETHFHDKDLRENIAPYGMKATFSIDKSCTLGEGEKIDKIDAKEVFDIKVNRRYLDHESSGSYLAFFQIDERVYELFVHFEGKHITNITLSEWLNEGDFEYGEDADNIYDAKNGLFNCDILES